MSWQDTHPQMYAYLLFCLELDAYLEDQGI
jgi:hypothetical protein